MIEVKEKRGKRSGHGREERISNKETKIILKKELQKIKENVLT